jgi:hypothetical protein
LRCLVRCLGAARLVAADCSARRHLAVLNSEFNNFARGLPLADLAARGTERDR